MNRIAIIRMVRNSKIVYAAYYYLGNFFINLLKLFLKPDKHLVLFVCYGGRSFEDSPKEIYEEMKKDHRFDEFKKVWAFIHPEKFDIPDNEKIKIDSFQYYKIALKARIWITNVSITRGMRFDGIHTLSLNSWHGTAIKHIGADITGDEVFKRRGSGRIADIMLGQGEYDVKVYSSAFCLPEKDVIVTGFPRNDSLVRDNNKAKIAELRKKMSIPEGKKVILYAPTYRDYEKNEEKDIVLKPPFNLDYWKSELEDEYVLFVRAHMAVIKVLSLQENEFVRDYSSYPNLNELLLVTDLLISDYSGILFDYSILGRPVFCYTYDYDKYVKVRGVYMDVRNVLPSYNEENELIEAIKHLDVIDGAKKAIQFRDTYVQQYGKASANVLNELISRIQE